MSEGYVSSASGGLFLQVDPGECTADVIAPISYEFPYDTYQDALAKVDSAEQT